MKERPILFSGAMVRALLAGTKTQTRRVLKPQPENDPAKHHPIAPYHNGRGGFNWVLAATGHGLGDPFPCPYGQPGDRLWVRETWSGEHCYQQEPPSQRVSVMTPDGPMLRNVIWYWADGEPDYGDWERPRPSIHMPRYASRITLEVTGVRVERLQDISEADAMAEGCERLYDDEPGYVHRDEPDYKLCPQCGGTRLYTAFNPGTGGALPDTDCEKCDTYVKRYQHLWESINGPESWAANPWVWVVEFKRLEQPA